MKKIAKIWLVVLTISLPFVSCRNNEASKLESLEKDRFIVKTEKARIRNLEEYILLTGSVRALDEAILYPRTTGKLLRNILNEGDPVKKDETVALIDRDEPGAVYEPAPVPSTLTGVVGRVYQDAGASVTPQTPVAMVVDQSMVRVSVDVPEKYIGRVFKGQVARIKVDAFPDRYFTGKVHKISPVVDVHSRNTTVEVLIDNTGGQLKSGMFAEVRLIVASNKTAVSVPVGAVINEDGTDFVFTPGPGGTALKVRVKTGIKTKEFIQITGVREGMEVITFGLYGLKDGSKIKVRN